MALLLPDPGLRRLITGFIFGTIGALIAVSPLGRVSGAHLNPTVTFSFVLMGRMRWRHAGGYVLAQLAGAAAGSIPLLAWGSLGRSVQFGSTAPGAGSTDWIALLGEAAATFVMLICLFFFLSRRNIRRYTPLLFPVLYALLVFLEAPLSGTSTNPARSLGPSLISGDWHSWWIYWVGPALGVLLAVGIHTRTWLGKLEIEVAKLYHFEHDPHGVFRPPGPVRGTSAAP